MSADTPVDPQPDEEARTEVATGSAPPAAEESAKTEAKAARRPARARKAAKPKEDTEKASPDAVASEKAKKPSAAKRPSRAKKPAAAKEPAATKEAPAERPAGKPAETVAERKAEAAPRRAAKGATPAPRRKVVRARARFVRTSARKARMVCGHLRGKSVPQARAILAFTPREVARDWSKLLESAVANAESNHELLEDDLIIREAYADEGPTIKRFRPRAMGRATPIRKRTSHLTITLTPGPERPTTKRHG